MTTILNLTGNWNLPVNINNIIKDRTFQPIDIDEEMDSEDIHSLATYLKEINADETYLVYTEETQALTAIRESDIKINAFFNII